MKLCLLIITAALLSSCSNLDGYKRTYSLNYETPQGQLVGVGVTLDPVKRSGK